ncbi:Trk system potassium transporter TrkA [soil metagenome]
MIVGAGEIGRHLALNLSNQAHNITVIETVEAHSQELDTQIDARVVTGDGSSATLLIESGVGECDIFFALTSSNNTNLIACSVARKLGAKKVICRVSPGLQRDSWIFDYSEHLGIDALFSSERLAAAELSKHIRNPASLMVEEIARGRIELQEVAVSEASPSAGRSLKDLALPSRVRVATIRRGAEQIIPTAEETLRAGDYVTLFGEPHKLSDVADKLGKGASVKESANVVIFGGGEYGFSLAQMLESWSCKVRIFDRDPAVCEALSHQLSNTTVINADATSLTELREEQVGSADFFVATTQSDEDNVMTCLQANNLGTAHCLTLIHRADYADAISLSGSKFGVMAAVSPRESTRQELMRFITSDRYHVVRKLDGGDLIESVVSEGAPAADRKVCEVEWPAGCVLVALVSGVHANVPAADDVIKVGDNIYAMVAAKAKRKFLKLL